jgi:hypothetical protein
MRALLIAFLGLSFLMPAEADEWHFEGGETPIAWFDNGAAQFQFACRGGQLAMGFWVRKPGATVGAASTMSLAITPDAAEGSVVTGDSGTSFAQDMPLVHLDGASVIVRGPVARQWARIAQGAGKSLRVAYVRQGAGGLEAFDVNQFGAAGSHAAINQVLAKCN